MAKQTYLNQMQWGVVLSEAWANNEFRQKLEQDPTTTIKKYAKERMGVELEHVFQLPPPPADLGVEALRSAGPSGGQGHAPGSVTGSGTAPGSVTGSGTAPGSVTGSGTSANSSNGQGTAPGSVTGSGTAPGSVTGSGTAPGSVCGSGTAGSGGDSNS
jgi:hypothetical protein